MAGMYSIATQQRFWSSEYNIHLVNVLNLHRKERSKESRIKEGHWWNILTQFLWSGGKGRCLTGVRFCWLDLFTQFTLTNFLHGVPNFLPDRNSISNRGPCRWLTHYFLRIRFWIWTLKCHLCNFKGNKTAVTVFSCVINIRTHCILRHSSNQ